MKRVKGKWEPATVVAINQDGPCSYIVKTSEGSYQQNRRHLKPTPNNLNKGQCYQADQSCDGWLDNWLEDTSTINEIPAGLGSNPSPLSQLPDHRGQFKNHQGTLTQTIELR